MKIMQRSKRITCIIDETLIKAGGHEYMWLWIAIEPIDKTILGIRIPIERNMLIAEQLFIKSLASFRTEKVNIYCCWINDDKYSKKERWLCTCSSLYD
jgi:transposase-like protein